METDIFDLSRLPLGCRGTIVSLSARGAERDRFMDLGFAPSLPVRALFKSPAKSPVAYEVMGAVLALRQEDAAKIMVRME